MKIILFLSRFAFICNIAFLFFVFFRWMEKRKPVTGTGDALHSVPLLKDLIITLGFAAVFINIIIHIVYLVFFFSRKMNRIPGWLITANFIFLVLQFIYYFLL